MIVKLVAYSSAIATSRCTYASMLRWLRGLAAITSFFITANLGREPLISINFLHEEDGTKLAHKDL